jgi:WD40 repeat protein
MSPTRLRIVGLTISASILFGAAAVGQKPPALESSSRTDLFGDPLPPGALARMGTIRYARGDSMMGNPVLAPDHKTFATVSRITPYGPGCVVCLWDAATGKELRHLDDPDFEPYQVFFLKSDNLLGVFGASRQAAPDGSFAYSMQLWDPATGKKAAGYAEQRVRPMASGVLSPDESCFASARQEPSVAVWERKTGKVLAQWKGPSRVYQLAFSPDGKTVAVGSGTAVHFWNWKGDGKARLLDNFPDGVERLWFSPDGRRIAAAFYKEGLRVWETESLKEVRRFKGEHNVCFYPDSKRIVSLETGTIWDAATGEKRGQLEDCTDCVALDFSANGRELMGYALGRVRFWDAANGKDHSPPAPTVPGVMIHQVAFLPGGKEVISASPDGAVRVWDAATGKELRTLIPGTAWDPQKTRPTLLRVTRDGTIVVAHMDRLSFFKGEGKVQELRLTSFPKGLESLNLSSDGKTLVLAARDQDQTVMELWDVPGRKSVAHFVPPYATSDMAFGVSCDRQIAAFVGSSIVLLDSSGAVSQTLENRPLRGDRSISYFYGIEALTFSPADDLLASSFPGGQGLRLLDVITGKPRYVVPSRQVAGLFNAVFSPDGQMIAAEADEGIVDVWETSTGRRRRRFLGHRSYQTTLAFSPDGGRLATGNRDGTILTWDVFGVTANGATASGAFTEAELDALWARLGEADAERACLAMGRLMRRPDEAGPYLKRRLLGRKSPDNSRLMRWIVGLDDDDFGARETASAELAKSLPSAWPLLQARHVDNPSAEARWRIEALLSRVDSYSLTQETIQDLRGLEVLESFGPAASMEVVRQLSEGNYDPSVVAAAKTARKRLTVKDRS